MVPLAKNSIVRNLGLSLPDILRPSPAFPSWCMVIRIVRDDAINQSLQRKKSTVAKHLSVFLFFRPLLESGGKT